MAQLAGLRNLCRQFDRFQAGLITAVLGRDSAGKPVRKTGVMATVLSGGTVAAGDAIDVELPALPNQVPRRFRQ